MRLKPGDVVKHFKRDDYINTNYPRLNTSWKSAEPSEYTYKILHFATHTETKERLVVYEALYTEHNLGVNKGDVFCRPYKMFMSEVDRNKYPNAKQKYRFELL